MYAFSQIVLFRSHHAKLNTPMRPENRGIQGRLPRAARFRHNLLDDRESHLVNLKASSFTS